MKSFGIGAVAAMTATMATHPLDVIKVRKQLSSNITYRGLFNGLPDALKRQVFYSGIRFGLYDVIGPKRQLTLSEKMCKGGFVGAVGALVATPFDLAKVRKQVGVVHAPKSLLAKWQGGAPTIARAAVVTSSQLSSFHHSKECLLRRGWQSDTTDTNVTAGFIAGVVTSLISNPLDVMKTWRMTGRLKKPQLPSLIRIIQQEGVLSLYRGIGPTLARMCPYVVVLFMTKEWLNAKCKPAASHNQNTSIRA